MRMSLYKVVMGLIEKNPKNVVRNFMSLNVLAYSAEIAAAKAVKYAQKGMNGKVFVDEVTNLAQVDLK